MTIKKTGGSIVIGFTSLSTILASTTAGDITGSNSSLSISDVSAVYWEGDDPSPTSSFTNKGLITTNIIAADPMQSIFTMSGLC